MRFSLRAAFAGSVLLAAALLSCKSSAYAAELVTLRSGFTIDCTSHEVISAETVRLYLGSSAADAQNYMDVPVASIMTVENAPEPPAVEPQLLPAPQAATLVDGIAQRSGKTHNLNVALLLAVIHAESAGNARAVSRAGARGLMQLMPSTATEMGVADSFSPESNVNGGSAYLDRLLTRYHENIALALAAYNAGPAAIDRYHGIPPFRETRLYVARVIREWNRLAAADTSAANQVAGR